MPATYWELRFHGGFYDPVCAGELCAEATDADACLVAFAELPAFPGFGWDSCHPFGCWRQIAWNRGDEVGVVGYEELTGFLGPLTSVEEVLIWLDAHAYTWAEGDLERGAVRPVDGGFELIVYQLVWYGPIRYDRLLLRVEDGAIDELRRWILSVDWDSDM